MLTMAVPEGEILAVHLFAIAIQFSLICQMTAMSRVQEVGSLRGYSLVQTLTACNHLATVQHIIDRQMTETSC